MSDLSAAALRPGEHTLAGPTTGSGLFSTFLASTGTFSGEFSAEHGQYAIWTTKATPGSKAGFRTNAVITSRAQDFTLNCSFKISSTIGVNFFIGLVDDLPGTFVTTGTAADPLNNLDGIGISLHAGNIKVAHNNINITEDELTVFDDFIEPVVFDAIVYNLTISSTTSTDGNLQVSISTPDFTVNTSTVLSSALPDLSSHLELQVFAETTTTESKSIEVYNCSGSF